MEQRNNKEDFRMLAEIPWIIKRPISKYIRVEDTYFYKNIGDKCSLEEKIRRLQLFWMLSETFPFYLPQRYHAMDCVSLHKNSKDGNYWANATVFLFNNAEYGHKFLEKMQSYLQSGTPDLKFLKQLTSVYKGIKQSHLKNNLEQCESAAEFLLNPWVLLQLPFQPMIMYQWAVALVAEACKFQKEIVEISLTACSKRLTVSAKKLTEMHSKLLRCGEDYLGILFGYTKSNINYYKFVQIYNNQYMDQIVNRFAEILPMIEFVLSQKCRDVIKVLKRLACDSTKNKKETYFVKTQSCTYMTSIFDYRFFWQCETKMTGLMPNATSEVSEEQSQEPGVEISIARLEQFVDEEMIQTGILKGTAGFDKDVIFKGVRCMRQHLEPLLLKYWTVKELLHGFVEPGKAGFISRCIALQLEADMAMLMALMARLVIHSVLSSRGARWLSLDLIDNLDHMPGLSLRQATEVISSIRPAQKWNYKNILKNVKATFNEELMEYPKYEQGAEKMAIHLQERIRRIVFKMIDQHYKSLKEKDFVLYPECQTVQFILPCFVASFLDLDKDPSASVETKKKYLQFVFEMVKSYETREFTHELKIETETVPFAFVTNSQLPTRITSRCLSVEKVLRQMLSRSKVFDAIILKGISSKLYSDTLFENSSSLLEQNKGWRFSVFMLNARMRSALIKIGFSDDPEQLLYDSQTFTALHVPTNMSIDQKQIFTAFTASQTPMAQSLPVDKKKRALLNLPIRLQASLVDDVIAIPKLKLQGLLLHLLVTHLDSDELQHHKTECIQGPGFPLDPVDSTLWSLFTKDMWRFKIQLANILTLREQNDDPTLVPFEFAKTKNCYRTIMKFITPEGKVDMSKPGEITLFPVKHCRWCGKVRVKEFRVCPICAETPDYPDLNIFCSENCEKEALEKQHEQEHCNFLLEECGF